MGRKPGRNPDESVEHDRLRAIANTIIEPKGLNPLKLVRKAGFDTDAKEGRAAYQAIKRWLEGRESEGQESKGPKKQPGENYSRHLPLKYRRQLFIYIRKDYSDEYIKPLPPGDQWITTEEWERWYSDTRSTRRVRRDPDALEDFVGYLKAGGTITQVTRQFVRAEIDYAGGESTAREYGPPGGLTEEDYQRLNDDDALFDTSQNLAWAVIDNLLWKKGLLNWQIRRIRRLLAKKLLTHVPEMSLMDLIEANSFEVVADTLYEEAVNGPKRKPQ